MCSLDFVYLFIGTCTPGWDRIKSTVPGLSKCAGDRRYRRLL